ncbi:MAG: DUF3040 domain-containing protein [Galactobacter sp.]
MPLSDHEQRLLDEMEKQLSDDPQFASSMRKAESAGRFSTRNIALGLLIAIVGLALVLVGVSLNQMVVVSISVGIVGFILMCTGVYVVFSKRPGDAKDTASAGQSAVNGSSSSYMRKLEQQWEDRRRGDEQR